ncbi:MAG: penicillin-insensitive murein endopeptidase, partial [Alphaproteobacteria bacterium]
IGAHAGGCLAGAVALPPSGPGWQVMRPGRNRHWAHPAAVAFIARLGTAARRLGWPGILIGDIAQPRGGPMRSGHASHQTGLDIDIWLRPAPPRILSVQERERLAAVSVLDGDRLRPGPAWTPAHAELLRMAAEDAAVARIFVAAPIKRALCAALPAAERGWLAKLRPWWGHDAHFHVRLACPADDAGCTDQQPPPPGDGCDATLDWWFTEEARTPPPPAAPRREVTLADLPAACGALVAMP